MEYRFSAERKLVFTVSTGGRNLLVEFSDRNSGGMSTFVTSNEKVAQAIRRTSLSRRGVIIESTPIQTASSSQPATPSAPRIPKSPKVPNSPKDPVSSAQSPNVREYDNFTVAREAVVKEFGIKKSDVRNPTSLARFAQEKGFSIKYKNAEQ